MSTLALGDLRWRSRRDAAGGPPLITAGFIENAYDQRTSRAVSGILAYFASLAGCPRHDYDADVPAEIAGDRRLGHALASICMNWYRWETPSFVDALPSEVATALASAGIGTPSALRLRLFDLVNAAYGGFVPAARRAEVLIRLATSLGLDPSGAAHLDAALALDAEGEARLVAAEPRPGVAGMVAAYNRAALSTILHHATRIVVSIKAPSGGLIRRLYAICRYLGVYCDLERADDQRMERGDGFRLTLAGPDAVVGPPAAAGPRLATVALRLLQQLGPDDSAVAGLMLHDRPYRLLLDRSLLRLPGLGQETPAVAAGRDDEGSLPADAAESPSYDSDVEAQLAHDFAGLQRQRRAAGWRLVREPAPLLAGSRVLLPDFALVRGELRVFVEVAGFWTPGYLTRKRQALEQLAPETPLILAVAPPAAAALAGLPFPLIPYTHMVAIDQLLAVAEARFGDFRARTRNAASRLAEACTPANGAWIPEIELASQLGCHGSGEVLRVLSEARLPDGWAHVPGAGLCGPMLHEALTRALQNAWASGGVDASLSLPELRARLAGKVLRQEEGDAAGPPPADRLSLGLTPALPEDDEALVSLLESLPACRVVRSSLFDVELRPPSYAVPPHAELNPRAGPLRRTRVRTNPLHPRPAASLF